MIVKVTQEHISEGEQYNCNLCPVALAIKEAMPYYAVVRVSYYDVSCWIVPETSIKFWDKPAGDRNFPLPREVGKRINDYDILGEMEPFEFELEEG